MTSAAAYPRANIGEVRRFYLALAVLLAILSTIGFWPQYFQPVLTGAGDSPTIIHIHATVFVAWLALFIAQCAFVAAGNIHLHRRVGNFGIVWGWVVVATGVVTTVVRFKQKLEVGGIESVENTAVFPFIDMVLFGTFFGLAVWFRHRPQLHKRLMIVAASSMLVASVARFAAQFVESPPIPHPLGLFLWVSPILLALAYEYWRQRILHPVYLVGGAVILISAFRGPIGQTETWVSFTHWMASVVS